jgi:hypothetical protein
MRGGYRVVRRDEDNRLRGVDGMNDFINVEIAACNVSARDPTCHTGSFQSLTDGLPHGIGGEA